MSAIKAVLVVTFEPKRMTPPTSPRRIRPSRSAVGVTPSMRTTSFWPINCAKVGAAAVAAGGAVGPILVGVDEANTTADAALVDPKTGRAGGYAPWLLHPTTNETTSRIPTNFFTSCLGAARHVSFNRTVGQMTYGTGAHSAWWQTEGL